MEKYRLNKEDVCLLVIDVQEKLVPIMKHGKAIIKNIIKDIKEKV